MQFLKGIVNRLFRSRLPETDPEKAYDLWAAAYDSQPDNLMLHMDNQLFFSLLDQTSVAGKSLIDIGCGTGRHWQQLIDRGPGSLTGYDVSAEMLQVLRRKFSQQKVQQLSDHRIAEPDHSCDMVVSTLTIAHISNAALAIAEWNRILKPGGEMIITDYHPAALVKGGQRTFRYQNRLVAVKNYLYSIEQVEKIAKQLGLSIVRISERTIDASVRSFYEKQDALPLYEKFKGVPIIYGIHLKKEHAVT